VKVLSSAHRFPAHSVLSGGVWGAVILAVVACASARAAETSGYPLAGTSILGQNRPNEYRPNRFAGYNLDTPVAVVFDPSSDAPNLFVADSRHHRILHFSQADAITSGSQAGMVLGHRSLYFTESNRYDLWESSVTERTLSFPSALAALKGFGGPWLIVADKGNHRILFFRAPFVSGQAAEIVLGQMDFESNAPNQGGTPSATSLHSPGGLAVTGSGRLWVADSGNHRLLAFDPPFLSGMAASDILGQDSYETALPGTAADAFTSPSGLCAGPGGWLWVADRGNHRVLGFDHTSTPATAASRVLGQPFFETGYSWPVSEQSLREPTRVIELASGSLWVSDTGNHRLLLFESVYTKPVTNASANAVLGQNTFTKALENTGGEPGALTLSFPGGLAVRGEYSALADTGNHRVKIMLSGRLPNLASRSSRERSFITSRINDISMIGQQSVMGNAVNGAAGNSLHLPHYFKIDRFSYPNRLLAVDTENARVLIWNELERLIVGGGAHVILGQSSAFSVLKKSDDRHLKRPLGVALAPSGSVYVSDSARILRYRKPQTTGMTGEKIFGDGSQQPTASSLSNPRGMAFDRQGNLWVADTDNHRVVVYLLAEEKLPESPADWVLGQPDFHSASPNAGFPTPNRTGFRSPSDITADDQNNIYVADTGNHRVLRFDQPLSTDFLADYVYGQKDPFNFSTAIPNSGGMALDTLNAPAGVQWSERGWLLVADTGNHRALRFQLFGTSGGISAHEVYGRSEGFAADRAASVSAATLAGPVGLDTDVLGRVYVADSQTHRIMQYSPQEPVGIVGVWLIDTDRNRQGGAGDVLVVQFPRPVIIAVPPTTFRAEDFALSGAGGSLGGDFRVTRSPVDPQLIMIRLGSGAEVRIKQEPGDGATLFDFNPTIHNKILDRTTFQSVGPTTPRHARLFFREVSGTIPASLGGTIQLAPDTSVPFIYHQLYVPSGVLANDTFFSLRPPGEDYGLTSVVEITGDTQAKLTLQFQASQINTEAGQILKAMRMVRVVGSQPPYTYIRYRGPVEIDPQRHTLTAPLDKVLSGTSHSAIQPLSGIPKEIIGGLPDLVIDPDDIFMIKPSHRKTAPETAATDSMAVLTPKTEGLYTRHRIEFPGYLLSTGGIHARIRQALGYERYGFPEHSGAVLAIEINPPLPPEQPVNLEIEYQDSSQLQFTDLRTFTGLRGPAGKLRLVQFDLNLPGYLFVPPARYERILLTGHDTVRIEGLRSFTGNPSEVYGLIIDPEASELPLPDQTPTPTASPTPEPTNSDTPIPGQTETPAPTPTPTPTPSPTETDIPPTPTPTPVPDTPTPSPSPLERILQGLMLH
jgi:sugar lactone lactonase YvrE